MQIVHNLQCRIIFADFVKERLVRALHVCRAQATKHQSHIVFASRGRSVHRVDGPAGHIGIDAVHFALDNDDGARTRHYDKADIILTGVSRSGKTPTSLYMALQFGVHVGNYPLTEDDFDDLRLPGALKEHKRKLFGLTIDPERLCAIRNERKANSRYASIQQCEMEIRAAEAMFNKEGIPYINTTHLSIEEISTRILAQAGIKRRLV